ncbi:MAG: hypothetical protein ABSG01_06115 [Anaerolineales bacterium]
MNPIQKGLHRLQTGSMSLTNDWQTIQLARVIRARAIVHVTQNPVIFFNASTRIRGHSLNAAFSLLASWAVRLQGTPVVHFVCQAGMSRCLQGTNQDDIYQSMPCRLCLRQSRANFWASTTNYFNFKRDEVLSEALAGLNIQALVQYEHPFEQVKIPLGELVLPSVRWRLRRLSLEDDEPTRFLVREFILSALNVVYEFDRLLERTNPQAIVLFNGQTFPEAAVYWLAARRGVRAITHEVSMYPLSGFFTAGQATALPMHMDENFELDPKENTRLDELMQNRYKGKFSMAGIRFFPEMKGLDEAFLQKAAGFNQIVPIFTNVIFDTTQQHSNAFFPDMFTWLDRVLEVIKKHPETLFVIRAHPDETRAGKVSRESVAMWVKQTGAAGLSNFVFIAPDEYISSYELIRIAKFIMIYNSTIGLESSIMGVPVLCAGSARFTDFGTVFFPDSAEAYFIQLEKFLSTNKLKIPPDHTRNSRRFFYFHYFLASLRFGEFLEPTAQRGFVKLKKFPLQLLSVSASPTISALVDGILDNGNFLLKE